jgi:hypothetical protein
MVKVSGRQMRLSHPSCRFVPMFVNGKRRSVLGTLCRWKDGTLPDVSLQVMSNYMQEFKCNSCP